MNKLRHPALALIVFTILISLSVTIYNGVKDYYGVTETETKYLNETGATGNIAEQLETLSIIDGMRDIGKSIARITNPANPADLAGAFLAAGIGVAKSVYGIIEFPFKILHIIGNYYHIPGIVIAGADALIILTVAFLLLSIYLRWDT